MCSWCSRRPGSATIAVAVYGTGLVALFLGSALYHRWPGPARFKPVLQRVDHSTIYVFIAASYTPIALVVLHGPLRWIILAVAWAGAAAGVAFSLGWVNAPRAVKAAGYLVLGWLAIIAAPQLVREAGAGATGICWPREECCTRSAPSFTPPSVRIPGREHSAFTRSFTDW